MAPSWPCASYYVIKCMAFVQPSDYLRHLGIFVLIFIFTHGHHIRTLTPLYVGPEVGRPSMTMSCSVAVIFAAARSCRGRLVVSRWAEDNNCRIYSWKPNLLPRAGSGAYIIMRHRLRESESVKRKCSLNRFMYAMTFMIVSPAGDPDEILAKGAS